MMGLYGVAGSLWLLICVHLLNIPMVFGSSICQTESYTEAGTNMKKPCSVECANLINGGALDSIYNKNCKILCEGCYEYIASLRKSTTMGYSSTTTPSAVHDITFSNGTILSPTEPSSACECDGLKIAVIVLSLVLIAVIVLVALCVAWKKGCFKRCGRNGENRGPETNPLNAVGQRGQIDGTNDDTRHDDHSIPGGEAEEPGRQHDHQAPGDGTRAPEPEAGPSVRPDSQEATGGRPVQASDEAKGKDAFNDEFFPVAH